MSGMTPESAHDRPVREGKVSPKPTEESPGWTLEVQDPYDGLRRALDIATTEVVVLHLPGGLQLRGKLISYPGDHARGIATVRSAGRPHHVPLHHIVVLEEVEE